MEALERTVWREVDVVIIRRTRKRRLSRAPSLASSRARCCPTASPILPRRGRPVAEPVILFVGGFAHLPNRHGALWFVEQVLPLIRARVPAARLTIAGSNPSPDVEALVGEAITVRANVSDGELRKFIAPHASPPCRCATAPA